MPGQTFLHSYLLCLNPTALYLDCVCMAGFELTCYSYCRDGIECLLFENMGKCGLQIHEKEKKKACMAVLQMIQGKKKTYPECEKKSEYFGRKIIVSNFSSAYCVYAVTGQC